MALDHKDEEAEGSRDWISRCLAGPLEQVFLVAGGQDEASGEAWALAHLPATKAVLCL